MWLWCDVVTPEIFFINGEKNKRENCYWPFPNCSYKNTLFFFSAPLFYILLNILPKSKRKKHNTLVLWKKEQTVCQWWYPNKHSFSLWGQTEMSHRLFWAKWSTKLIPLRTQWYATDRQQISTITNDCEDRAKWKPATLWAGVHGHIFAAAAAESLQSSPTLCDPLDGSPPGSPVPGTLKARVLE